MTQPSGKCGGIDLGGTKIEARLYDETGTKTLAVHRIATPKETYDALVAALSAQIDWLIAQATPDMPIGIALPGLVDPETGRVFAANVINSGQRLGPDLAAHHGREFAVVNDCMAFALSEAQGGAGAGLRSVMGLVLGTGVGGGYCINGALVPRLGGLAVEIGHVGLPAAALARHNLPVLRCGCGRLGCMETYVSGTGLANIAEQRLGKRLSAETLVAGDHDEILEIWTDIAGECLLNLHYILAADCIVLGGGLSNMPDILPRLSASLATHAFADTVLPKLAIAQHGDSSGARGAALLARAS